MRITIRGGTIKEMQLQDGDTHARVVIEVPDVDRRTIGLDQINLDTQVVITTDALSQIVTIQGDGMITHPSS
jgi:hypothetical protein